MRKIIWGLRSVIVILIVSQIVLSMGIAATWFDARQQVMKTRMQLDGQVLSSAAQVEEIMKLFQTNLKTMRLIKQRQDEQHALLHEIMEQTERPVMTPTPPAFKPPRSGRPVK